MKMEGFPSTWCHPRLVIPAPWSTGQNSTGGIQFCCAELAWIPAFAGMTEPGRASWFSSPNGYFQRRHEEHEVKKFRNIILRNLRGLRVLRGAKAFHRFAK